MSADDSWVDESLAWAAEATRRFDAERRKAGDLADAQLPARRVAAKRLFSQAQTLGNLYWAVGMRTDAAKWLSEAASLFETFEGRPAVTRAFLFWKIGDAARLEAECRALVARRSGVVESDKAGGSTRAQMLAFRDLAIGSLLLGDYGEARRWAERVERLAEYSGSTFAALAQLAGALHRRDPEGFEDGVERLGRLIRPWPSFESDDNLDLYRWARESRTAALG